MGTPERLIDLSEVPKLDVMAQRTLLRMIEGKLTAPVVGFPLSGVVGKHVPFRVDRERLQTALSGLPAGTWKVTLDCSSDANQRDPWTLTIEASWRSKASGNLCRSRTVLRALNVYPWKLRNRMHAWAERQRVKSVPVEVQPAAGGKSAAGKRNRYQVRVRQCEEQIAKLERQLTTDRPWNSCLKERIKAPRPLWLCERREHDSDWQHERNDWHRNNQLQWKGEASSRRKVAQIAGKYLTETYIRDQPASKRPRYTRSRSQVKWTELYAELAAAGFPVRDQNKFGRVGHLKHGPSESEYLRHLYQYVGLTKANHCKLDRSERKPDRVAKMAAEHMQELRDVAVARRERTGVLSEIENLKQLIISYKEMASAHSGLSGLEDVVDAGKADTGAEHDRVDGDRNVDALAGPQDSGREVEAES